MFQFVTTQVFSHFSSALGIKTITLMADTPLIYGSYSSNMYPIIPMVRLLWEHNTLGKDKINPDKILINLYLLSIRKYLLLLFL
jgi:heptosyltransferase-2